MPPAPPMPGDIVNVYYSDYAYGNSLFQLSFKYTVNHPLLWSFFVYLLMFMIAVDTAQRIALRFAGDDRCFVMFVNRCISELMMFGAVAISILLMDEFSGKSLPSIRKDQIHWVDVFCSISACLLILVGYWAWVFVVPSKEYYRKLRERCNCEASVDFFVFGGKITRQLAEDYGLHEVYDFGDYVREVTGQLIAELIDVNLITWVSFGLPPIVGVLVTHVYEASEVTRFLEFNETTRELIYQNTYGSGGPRPSPTEVELFLGVGWIWFAMSIALEVLVVSSMRQLRALYGYYGVAQVQEAMAAIESTPIAELRHRRSTLEQPNRRASLDDTPRARVATLNAVPEPMEDGAASGGGAGRAHACTGSNNNLIRGIEMAGPSHAESRRTSNAPYALEKSAELSADFALKAELLSRNLQRAATVGPAAMNKGILSLQEAGEDEALPCPRASIWAARHLDTIKQLLQIIMLYSCGQVALYALSLAYGIESSTIGAGWHVFALLPPITTLFLLLPHLCHSLALFEAYAVPNAPVLDAVISDIDQRAMDFAYLKAQLRKRVDSAHEGHSHGFGRNLAERLERFEVEFEWTHTPLRRYWRAFYDLARGQALCFVGRRACFLVGVLEVAAVPASRERLERLVPWYNSEVGEHDTLSVAELFRKLQVDPPVPAKGQQQV